MEKLRAIFVKMQNISCNLIALCMVLMMSVIFIQTMTRYVIFYSIPWSEELSRYLYVTLTLMGVNIAISRRQLVRIDIIDNYLKGVALKRLNIIRAALTLVICIIFFYSSFGMIDVSQYQTSPAMGISMQIMYSILGLGFLMSSIASLFELYDAFNVDDKE